MFFEVIFSFMNLVLANFNLNKLKDMTFNHDYCQKRKFDNSLEDSTFENVDDFDTEYLTQDQKYGDELLIDLIRSRPFLYDKKIKEFRDTIMKENAWAEMASILGISVSDCQVRWTRLRQRFSKERQLRENETRKKVVHPRRTYSNITEKISSCMNTQSFMEKSVQNETHDETYDDNMEYNSVSRQFNLCNSRPQMRLSSFSQMQQSTPSLTQYEHEQRNSFVQCGISNTNQSSFSSASSVQVTPESTPSPMQRSTPSPMLRSTPSPIRPSSAPLPYRMLNSDTNKSSTSAKMLNMPSSCFTETNRPLKKSKDNVEAAFCQMNTTLNTVASRIVQNRTDNDINDPDMIIGKLVTAELKKTMEPTKTTLKRKFMEILYSHQE